MDKIVETLAGAKARIEQGWCQGRAADVDGSVCILGALSRSTLALGYTGSDVWQDAEDALMSKLPNGYESVVMFNDSPHTTKQDVVNLFDKALADLGGLGLSLGD